MRRREHGFALFVVVALLALMAVLVADFVALGQTDIRATRNAAELARARALAEAGYAMALDDLLNPEPGNPSPADGRSRAVSFDGGRITLTIQDEAGKIDLNWAPVELLSGMLDGLEIPGDAEARILDAVAERRGRMLLPKYAPGDIAASALLGGPSFARLARMPFASVDELQSIAKIDPATFTRIRPALTVYSESRRINFGAAPRAVLMAIPGVTASMADAIVASRNGGGPPPAGAVQLIANGGGYSGMGGLRAVTITADAVTAVGMRFKRSAVVSFTGEPMAPFRVLEWRQAAE